MSEPEVLLPAEAARRLGVATRVVIEAMHESGAHDVQSVRARLIDLVGHACAPRSA